MSVIERLENYKNQKDITSWTFKEDDLTAKEARQVADALKDFPKVEELSFREIRGRKGAFEELCEAFKEDECPVKTLDLRRCELTVGGANALAEALKVNKTIEILYINECEIPVEGIEAICESFRANKSVQTLDYRRNPNPLKAVLALTEALKVNSTLLKLIFFSAGPCFSTRDYISDKGAAAFGEMLKENTTVETLDLKYNQITYPASLKLLETIGEKKALRLLDLSYNAITPDDKDKLLGTNMAKRYVPTLWCCSD